MNYIGYGVEEALSVLGNNDVVWKHVSCAHLVAPLGIDSQRVKVYCVVKEGGGTSVVKYSTRERTEQASDQIMAENKAAMLLSDYGAHPLLVLPVKTIIDPDVGSFIITPYAGLSTTELRQRFWVNLGVSEYDQLCKIFAVSALLTQKLFYGSVDDGRRRFLHRDIKLQNTCYDAQYNIFPLVDYGAFSSVDQQQGVNCIDWRYLDPQTALYYLMLDLSAAEFDAGLKATINATTDLYLTAVAVVELFLDHLPAEIDLSKYSDRIRDYLTAVCEFRWDNCAELSNMPTLMKSWVLKALAFDPKNRFQSAEEALRHPWLEGAELPVLTAVEKAQPGWQQLVEELKQDLTADMSCNGDGASSTAPPLTPFSNVPYAGWPQSRLPGSAAVPESANGNSIAVGAYHVQAVDSGYRVEQEYEDHQQYEDDQEYEYEVEYVDEFEYEDGQGYTDDLEYEDDQGYGAAQYYQQHHDAEQYDGDHAIYDADYDSYSRHNTNNFMHNSYNSRGSSAGCDVDAEGFMSLAYEYCRSSAHAVPPAAGVTPALAAGVDLGLNGHQHLVPPACGSGSSNGSTTTQGVTASDPVVRPPGKVSSLEYRLRQYLPIFQCPGPY